MKHHGIFVIVESLLLQKYYSRALQQHRLNGIASERLKFARFDCSLRIWISFKAESKLFSLVSTTSNSKIQDKELESFRRKIFLSFEDFNV